MNVEEEPIAELPRYTVRLNPLNGSYVSWMDMVLRVEELNELLSLNPLNGSYVSWILEKILQLKFLL